MVFSSSASIFTCTFLFYLWNSLTGTRYHYPPILNGVSLHQLAQTKNHGVILDISLSLLLFISSISKFYSLHLQDKPRVQPLLTTLYGHLDPSLHSSSLSLVPLLCKQSPYCCPCFPIVCFPPWGKSSFFNTQIWSCHSNAGKPPVISHLRVKPMLLPWLWRLHYLPDLDHSSSHTGLLALPQRLQVHLHLRALVPTLPSAFDASSSPRSFLYGFPWFLHVSVPYQNAFLSWPTCILSLSLTLLYFQESIYHHLTYHVFLCLLVCYLSPPTIGLSSLSPGTFVSLVQSSSYRACHIVKVQ